MNNRIEELATELDLVQDALEGARTSYAPVPTEGLSWQGFIHIPFVVLGWDDGLDSDGEGNYFQDSPPCEYVHSCHRSQETAEATLSRIKAAIPDGSFWICKDYHAADYEAGDPAKWS